MIGLLIICFSNALETIRLKTYNAGATIVWSCEIRQPPRTINGYIKIPSAIRRTESSIAKKARASFRPWRILLSSNFGVASSSPFSDMGSLLSSVVVWDSGWLSLMVEVTILPLRWKGTELELRNLWQRQRLNSNSNWAAKEMISAANMAPMEWLNESSLWLRSGTHRVHSRVRATAANY